MRAAALANFHFFREHYLGTTSWAAQKRWIDLVEKHKLVLTLCPGGHGKSMTVVDYVTWLIVKNRFEKVLGRDIGEINIVIVSVSAGLGSGWLAQIKAHLESKRVVEDFGIFRNAGCWSSDEIRALTPNNPSARVDHPTLRTLGIDGQIFGPRADFIVPDDIVNKENSATDEQRRKLDHKYHQGVRSWLRPSGKVWCIGTRQHSKDLYATIEKRRKYKVLIERAINWDTGEVLCPENKQYTYRYFKSLKEELGTTSFNCRFMNLALDEGEVIIRPDWVDMCFDERLSWGQFRGDIVSVIAVDPAVSPANRSSNFAMVCWGYSPKTPDRRVVVDYLEKKVRSDAQPALIVDWWLRYGSVAIVIERNAQQRYLRDAVMAEARTRGFTPAVEMPFTGSNKNDRDIGVQRLAPLFEYCRVSIPYGEGGRQKAEELRDSLSQSTPNSVTDITMACWFGEESISQRLEHSVRLYRRRDVPWYLKVAK